MGAMKRVALLLALLLGTALLLASPAGAQDAGDAELTCHLYGMVELNGEAVPDGTAVTAILDGAEYSTGTSTDPSGNAIYSLDIQVPESADSSSPLPVFFTVDDLAAAETAFCIPGGTVIANLTARGEPGEAPPPASRFYGTVKLNGKAASNGTVITAIIHGDRLTTRTTRDSQGNAAYAMTIMPGQGQTYPEAEPILFIIGNLGTEESGIFEPGSIARLDLNARGENKGNSLIPTIALLLLAAGAIVGLSPLRHRIARLPKGRLWVWLGLGGPFIASIWLLATMTWTFSRFPTDLYVPLGDWTNSVVDWLTDNLQPLFDVITTIIREPLMVIRDRLLDAPWWVVLLVFVLIAARFGGRGIAAFTAIALFFIGMLGHSQDYTFWELTMLTLAIMIVAVVISVAIAIPLGILAGRSNRFEAILRPILDAMQTMPSFVYLVPAVIFFHLGMVPAVIATVIYAVPPCIRLTDLGIRQVPEEVVEAGQAFGTTPWQLLLKIQLPLAMPNIMAGITQTVMMALAMVVIGSMIAAPGLGLEVLRGIQRINTGQAFTAGLAIVLLAMILDRMTQSIGRIGPDRNPSRRQNRWLRIILG